MTDSGCGRARECDERTAAEIQSSLTTGVLKNHRNDAYTRMSQNIKRVNTSQRKQAEAHEHEAAIEEIENEITVLTKSHQETRERLKSLKASKTDLRKRKSSSKAESNSSGRVRTTTTSGSLSAKARKVTIAAKVGSKKCKHYYSFIFFSSISFMMPAEIKSRKDSSSLSGSSTANQAAASTPQLSRPMEMEMDFVIGSGGILEMDWMTGSLPSGAYYLNVTYYSSISFSFLFLQGPPLKAMKIILSMSTTGMIHHFHYHCRRLRVWHIICLSQHHLILLSYPHQCRHRLRGVHSFYPQMIRTQTLYWRMFKLTTCWKQEPILWMALE